MAFALYPTTIVVSGGISDTLRNTWTQSVGPSNGGAGTIVMKGYMYQAMEMAGAGPDTITVGFSAAPTNVDYTCLEFSGVTDTTLHSQANTGTLSSGTISAASSSFTPTANNAVYSFVFYTTCGSTSSITYDTAQYTAGSALTTDFATGTLCTASSHEQMNVADQYWAPDSATANTATFSIPSGTVDTQNTRSWGELRLEFTQQVTQPVTITAANSESGLLTGEAATLVIGHNDFTTGGAATTQWTLNNPTFSLFDSSGNLWVSDYLNNRILEYKAPFTDGEPATIVLGQSSFAAGGSATTSTGLFNPIGLAFDSSGNLWAADYRNNRVVEYTTPFSTGEAASIEIGQVDMNHNTQTTGQNGLNNPHEIAFDSSGNLWVADRTNNRVLEFLEGSGFTSDEAASLVIGQADYTHYGIGTTSTTLSAPTGIAFDSSGNLWTVEYGNNRILEFLKGSGFTTQEAATLVIGQADFTHGTGAITQTTLDQPVSMTFDSSGNIWETEYATNRAMEFLKGAGFVTGQAAHLVIGQSSFTTSGSGTTSTTVGNLYDPTFDSSGNLWIADRGNDRILEYTEYGTFAVSGCSQVPNQVPADGNTHNILAAASATCTITVPTDLTNSRYRFAASATTEAVTACSSGTCSGSSFTTYLELQNTWQASTNGQGPPTWDSALSIIPTGTLDGIASTNVCTMSPSSGTTTTATCAGWSDYNLAVAAPLMASGSGSNIQWQLSGITNYTPTTGGNTETAFAYYKQLSNTYNAIPNAQGTWDAGLTSQNVVGTYLGSTGQTICTITLTSGSGAQSCAGYADYNMAAVIGAATIGGAPANTQWLRSGTCSFTQTTGGNTNNCNYYKQLQNTYQAIPSAPSTWDASPALSLDGSHALVCTNVLSCGTPLTTADTNDLIIAMCAGNAGQTGYTVSDTSSLTWHQRGSLLTGPGSQALGVFYATSATKLTADSISCTNVPSGTHNLIVSVFGVNGADAATPFDTNGGLPNTNSAVSTSTPSCTMTTSNANDMLIAFMEHGGNSITATPTGFATIQTTAGSPSSYSGYDVVSAMQNAASESWTLNSNTYWATWCDAIRAAVGPVAVTGTLLGSAGQLICTTSAPSAGSSSALSCSGYADYNTAASMGVLSVSSNERWAPLTAAYTDTSAGNTHSDSYYEQLQNTFQATPNAQATWDAGLTSQNAVGTSLGSAGQTICSITLTSGGGAQSCTGYADYNLAVGIGSATIGGAPANSQWLRSGACSFIQTTGGNTDNCNFYKQWTETWQATANAQATFDSSLSTTVSGTVLGVGSTTICTISPSSGQATGTCSGYVDNNQAATFSTTMSGAALNTQWKCGTCTTGSQTSGGNTVNINYYKQLQNTYQAVPNAQVTWDGGLTAQNAVGTVLGSGASTVCTITLTSGGGAQTCNGWADYNLAVVIGAPTIGGAPANSQWIRNGACSFTQTTGGNTDNCNYFKQYTNNFAYSVTYGGSPTAPTLTCTQLGANVDCGTLSMSNSAIWVDSGGSYSATDPTTGSSGTERWDSNSASGIISSGGGTVTIAYYHQYLQTLSYSVVGGGSPTPPTATGSEFGSTYAPSVTGSPTGYWFDATGSVTFTDPISGAANERWDSAIPSISATSSATTALAYYHQYQNTYQAVPLARTTFDGVYVITLTGTFLGTASSTICSVTTSNGGGTASCSGYSDYNTLVSMGTIIGAPANTRWQQSGTSSWTDTTGGNTHAVNFYDQTTNTYTFSPAAPATWDNPFSPTIVGTLLGVPSSTICTASLSSGGGAASCSGYSDYNSGANFPAAIADGSNVQWTGVAPLSFTDTTGGNTHTAHYYEQYSGLTFTATPSAPSTWDNAFSIGVTGTSLGVSGMLCTITATSGGGASSCSSLIDAGTAVSFSNPLSDGANMRWDTGQATQTLGAGSTSVANYFLQLQNSYQVTPNAQLTWDAGLSAPTVTGTILGVGSSDVCTLTLISGGGVASCSGWADYNLPVSLGTIGGAPPNSRWEARGTTSFTDSSSGGNTYNVNYYKQYTLAVVGGNGIGYSVVSQTGDNFWDSGTSLTVSSNGVYDRLAGTGQRVSSWDIDGGPNTIVVSLGFVTTSPVSMSASHTVDFSSVTQYQVSLDLGSQTSLSSCTPPTISGDGYWYDSGSAVTCVLNGVWGRAGGTGERLTSYSLNGGAPTAVSTTGTVTPLNVAGIASPQSITSIIIAQYQLALSVTPASAGTASYGTTSTIAGDTGWYDTGTAVSFSVVPNPGFQFSRWVGSGFCSYSGTLLTDAISLTCVASELANFGTTVTQPIVLQAAVPGGPVPEFTVNGCYPGPSAIPGDGTTELVHLSRSCSFTVSIFNTGDTRYGFLVSGSFSSTSPGELSCVIGTCDPITLIYYQQVNELFAYSVLDGTVGYSAPTLFCTQLGSSGPCGVLTGVPTSYWLDYGSSWSATNPLTGSNGTVRWESTDASGFVSSPSSAVVAYFHQFLVSIVASPPSGGTTVPPSGTSEWVNSSSSISLSASPEAGYIFTSWSASNSLAVHFSSDTAASTSATVTGPAVIAAHFGLALVALTFSESGLPDGTTWSVTVAGNALSSSGTSIAFDLPPGSYSWAVATPLSGADQGVRFITSASGGTTALKGPETLQVPFTTQYYLTVSVGSSASGITLSPVSGWYDAGSDVALDASASASTYLTFVSWTGTGAGSYSGSDAVSSVTMNGPITETANFVAEMGTVTFIESGLPAGAEWSVVLNGVNQTSQGGTITFANVPVGATANWVVKSPMSEPGTGSIQVLTPQIITITITFTTSPTTVTSTVMSTGTSGTTTLTITVTGSSSTGSSTTSSSQGGSGLNYLYYVLIPLVAILTALLMLVLTRRRKGNA